jgi:anti-sigma factor RsiW
MNSHRKIDQWLEAYVLGELPVQQQTDVEIHLRQCRRCSVRHEQLSSLLECAARIGRASADERTCSKAKQAVLQTLDEHTDRQFASGPAFRPALLWRKAMNTPKVRLIAAAIIVAVVIGGISLWPGGGTSAQSWWLQPPAAWAGDIDRSLNTIEALVHRERAVFVRPYGSTHISGTWRRICESPNARREDTYFGEDITKVRWDLPDGNEVVKYEVSYEFECYVIERYENSQSRRDPVEILRFYVGLLPKADRILGTEIFEGHECVGFEISADKYGSNPPEWIDRIWFDVKTRLPVRIEKHGRPVMERQEQTFTFIQDEFEYYAQVPADLLTPEIPEGFINKSAYEVQKEREAQREAQMTFADVPAELKKEVIAALQDIDTAVFLKDGVVISICPNAWRKDFYDSGDRLYITEWYCVEKEDMADTSMDFNDKNYRLKKTTVNYAAKTFAEETYGADSHPGNPMDRIWQPIGFIERADRILENTFIDGSECFGLELSAKKYGTNPDSAIHRLWFDVRTNLPVRLEFETVSDDGIQRRQVWDQFEWNPELPEDTFVPQIPGGFTLAEPSEM